MARPKKLRLKLTAESLTELIQESYRELCEQRSTALRQINSQLKIIKTSTDIPLIGKTNADLLKIIDQTIEKKISIARLQKDIVFKDTTVDKTSEDTLSIEDKKAIFDMVSKDGSGMLREKMRKKNIDFDLNNDID